MLLGKLLGEALGEAFLEAPGGAARGVYRYRMWRWTELIMKYRYRTPAVLELITNYRTVHVCPVN